MDLLKTERILVGEILADLYATASTEARRALELRTRMDQLAAPFSPSGTPKKCIIEIGCGYGFTSNYLALLHPYTQVIGIDPDPARVAIARETIGQRGNIAFYATAECADRTFDCDVMILNHLLWRADFAESQRHILENASLWLSPKGELMVRALDPDTHWLRVMAENLRETVLAGEALTTLSREDLMEFCKALGFRQNDFKLDGMYYRAGSQPLSSSPMRKKPFGSVPQQRRMPEAHDAELDVIFARPWEELKV